MERTQENSLYSYLYLKVAKLPCFSYYFYVFASIKLENRRTEQVLPSGGWGCWHWWEGERGGDRERGRRVNMVQRVYTHVCKYKNDTCQNCSRNGEGGMKESSGGGKFMYDI
jgi:hypothetical protein